MALVVPFLTVVFVLAAIVWPLARLWRRTGVFGLVAWRARSPVAHLTALLFAGGVGAFAALGSALALRPELAWPVPPAVAAVGLVVALVGLAIVLVAQAQMGASWRIGIDDRPTALVEHGLYRWSRNPIYAGVLLWLLGLLLVVPSAPGVALAALVAVVVSVQARLEERHLIALHGERYRAYAARVGRFFPRIGV